MESNNKNNNNNISQSPSKNLGSWLRFRSTKSSETVTNTDLNEHTQLFDKSVRNNNTFDNNHLAPPQKNVLVRPSFTKSLSSGAHRGIQRVTSPLKNTTNVVANERKSPLKKSSRESSSNNEKKEEADKEASMTAYKQYRDDFLKDKHQFHGKVFGVSLEESLKTSSAEVLLQCDQVSFGRIPIVVAKCGSYLKKNGLNHPGIFRIAGNNKRVKNLQLIFSEPPHYGLSFNEWESEGFTVHDSATILRRYLNHLEEPLIPLSLYNKFREPLEKRVRILKNMKKGKSNFFTKQQEIDLKLEKIQLSSLSKDEKKNNTEVIAKRKSNYNKRKLIKDIRSCLKEYESLFVELLSDDTKQLLIYLLDLLSLFAQHSETNLMSSKNLAAIFQPSILSHPDHDMNPAQYELSRYCVEFLIDFSYKILPHILNIPKSKMKKTETKIENSKPQILSETDAKPFPRESGDDTVQRIPSEQDSSAEFRTHRRTPSRPYSKSLSSKPNEVHDVLRIVNKDPNDDDEDDEDEDDDEDYSEQESDYSKRANATAEEDDDADDANNTTIDYDGYMNNLGFEPVEMMSSPMASLLGSSMKYESPDICSIVSPVGSPVLRQADTKVKTKSTSNTTVTRNPVSQFSHLESNKNLAPPVEIPPKLNKRHSWFQKMKSQASL